MDELDLEIAASQSVADVMIKRPKTIAAGATVSDARRAFENPRVQVCPLVEDDGRLVGELTRDLIPDSADDAAPAPRLRRRPPAHHLAARQHGRRPWSVSSSWAANAWP